MVSMVLCNGRKFLLESHQNIGRISPPNVMAMRHHMQYGMNAKENKIAPFNHHDEWVPSLAASGHKRTVQLAMDT
jgi:hypothetical protein